MTRVRLAALLAGLVGAGIPAAELRAQDAAEPSYFSRRYAGSGVTPDRVRGGADGSTYVAGRTTTADLPAAIDPPEIDSDEWSHFVTAFGPDGTPRWTAFAPTRLRWTQSVRDLQIADDGSVWLLGTGSTIPEGEPEPSWIPSGWENQWSVWVARFRSDGSLAFAHDLGGEQADAAAGLVLVPGGDAVVAGLTRSRDFPVVNAPAPDLGAGPVFESFATRIRLDGTIVWSTLLTGYGSGNVSALADGGNGEVLLVGNLGTSGSWYSLDWFWDHPTYVPALHSTTVTRIAPDGTLVSTLDAPRGGQGGGFSVSAAADGAVIVGGAYGAGPDPSDYYWLPTEDSGYAAIVPAGGASPSAIWRTPNAPVDRLAVLPSGDVVAAAGLSSRPWDGATVALLGPDLSQKAILLAASGNDSRIDDVAVGPDGALRVVGSGSAVLFDGLDTTGIPGARFVARLPLEGASPPTEVRAFRRGRRGVRLSWVPGADPVARYEVENLVATTARAAYTKIGTADGSATECTVRVPRRGASDDFRLVAVFPSGMRTTVPVSDVATTPPRLDFVRAESVGPGAFRVTWGWDEEPWGDSRFAVERRIGDGPFFAVRLRKVRVPGHGLSRVDVVPPFTGRKVTWRVRAIDRDTRLRSPWAVSEPAEIRADGAVPAGASGRLR